MTTKRLPDLACLLTPRRTRPELFGSCGVRLLTRGEHAPTTPR